MATMRPSRMTIVALSIGAPPLPSITRAPRRAVVWASASVDAPTRSAKDAPISERNRRRPRIAKSSQWVSRRFRRNVFAKQRLGVGWLSVDASDENIAHIVEAGDLFALRDFSALHVRFSNRPSGSSTFR